MAETRSPGLTNALDEASISRFHLRAVLVSGMGFFTDAYDLFVIGIAATLIKQQWHLDSARLALLNSTMLFAAFLGAFVFGRVADILGRKRVYWLVAAIMVVGALGSALSPSFWVLIVFRFGLIPLACAIFTIDMLASVPFTADFSAWYMTASVLALFSVVALAGWGFYQSLGGEPLWRPEIE